MILLRSDPAYLAMKQGRPDRFVILDFINEAASLSSLVTGDF